MKTSSKSSYEPAPIVGESDSPFRLESLLGRCLSDREFCAAFMQKFADRAADLSTQIEEAARSELRGELALHAHAVKGLAANLSADDLHFWAAALERSAQTGSREQSRSLAARVRAEIERCLAAMPHALEWIGRQP